MRAATFLLKRYRAELGPMLLLGLIVAMTAFLAAVGPRLFNRVADEGLRQEVAEAQSGQRNLELGQIGVIAGGERLDAVATRGSELEAELPESVRSLLTGSTHHAESANWSVIDPPRDQPSWVRFRFSEDVEERISWVDGRPPTGATTTIPGQRGTIPGEPEDATVFEAALSVEIAEALGVGVGDRLEMQPDTDDMLVGQFSSPVRAAIDVVGVYTVNDPAAEVWMDDPSLDMPTIVVVSPNLQLIYATALLSVDAYVPLIEKGLPARYAWRYFIDPARLDTGGLDRLTSDLRRMETRYPAFVTSMLDADVTTLRTGLLDLANGFAVERRTAEALLITASLGPAAVAAAAVALVALLIVHRRRRAISVVRGRGGSLSQLLGSHLVEALAVTVPAAAAGFLAATLVDARPTAWSPIAAALVAGGATLVLLLTVGNAASAPLREAERESPSVPRAGPRRIAFEVVVVVGAVVGAVLLRQRGIAGGSTAGELTGADPLLAAVPALIGLAVGLVAVRVYPLPLRAAGWFADGWRGMVPAFGLRRAARTGDVGTLPLIVLLVTVAIGAFSSTAFVAIGRGQDAAAWQQVGADLAVTPGTRPVPSDLDPMALPGVDAAARLHADVVSLGGRGGQRVEMNALETAAYAAVTAGTGADPNLPGAMTAPPAAERPIPAILSERAAAGAGRPIRAGDEVELLVSAREAMLRVVEIRDSFPGVDPDAPWLVVPIDGLRAAVGDRAFAASTVFLRAPDVSENEMQAAMNAVLPSTDVTGRAEVLEQLRSAPLIRGVGAGFALAVLVAVAYAALAATAALVLVAAVRSRETAHLRTLGVTPRGLVALEVVEHAPAIVAATIIGVGLGVGVAWFVAPGLDLAGLIGSPVAVSLTVDWQVVGALVAALVVVLAVAIAAATWVGRRASLAAATRRGIE